MTKRFNKVFSVLAVLLIATLMLGTLAISVFADETASNATASNATASNATASNATDSSATTSNATDSSATDSNGTKKDTLGDKIKAWADSDVGQILGYIAAGILLVAMVLVVIWWIPKDNTKKGNKNSKK